MEDPHEEDFLDVEQLISLEAVVAFYYDEQEETQEQAYESVTENMQGDHEATQNREGGTPAASRKQLTLQKKGRL
ncbi:unnamed protein product [Amaranthus hypochondriacus]